MAWTALKEEMVAAHAAIFGAPYLEKLAEVEASGFEVVPEPGPLGLIGLAFVGTLRRRRRAGR